MTFAILKSLNLWETSNDLGAIRMKRLAWHVVVDHPSVLDYITVTGNSTLYLAKLSIDGSECNKERSECHPGTAFYDNQ